MMKGLLVPLCDLPHHSFGMGSATQRNLPIRKVEHENRCSQRDQEPGVPRRCNSGGVHQLVQHGHEVLIEAGAGIGSAISDEAYQHAGATLVGSAAEAWGAADLLLKVKEPIASEYQYLRPDMVLFTYLHLAADQPQTETLLSSGATAIAYETVQTDRGALPLLSPMR